MLVLPSEPPSQSEPICERVQQAFAESLANGLLHLATRELTASLPSEFVWARDFASRQELDERTAAFAKSEADLAFKRAQHAAGKAGPTAEERALADARVVLAEATVTDLQAKLLQAQAQAAPAPDPNGQLLQKWLTDPTLDWNAALVAKLQQLFTLGGVDAAVA